MASHVALPCHSLGALPRAKQERPRGDGCPLCRRTTAPRGSRRRRLCTCSDRETRGTEGNSSSTRPRVPQILTAAGAAVGLAIAVDVFRFLRSLSSGTIGRWRTLGVADDGRGELGATATEPTVIYDVDGNVVAKFSSEMVTLQQVADPLWQAVVSAEDRRFFFHSGIDARGLLRAVLSLGRNGGGSTITQQLVKNMLLSSDRTLSRKVVEIAMALSLEMQLSKPKILERYLNTCYWGHGVYGIAGASAAYFRKKPSELTLSEGALLAALLPSPEYLSPFKDAVAAKRVHAQVLRCMAQCGYVEDGECQKLLAEGLPRSLAIDCNYDDEQANRDLPGGPPAGAPYRAPYFVSEVLYQLKELCGSNISDSRGGLHIHTTLDFKLQEHAEKLLKASGPTSIRGEAALVAMDPKNGAVRVLVGGRDYGASPYNRAVDARRSPGSTFKPVVYAAALDQGVVTPSTSIQDSHVVYRRPNPTSGWQEYSDDLSPSRSENDPAQHGGGQGKRLLGSIASRDQELEYEPENFSRRFRGEVTVKECFAQSLNVPTIKIAHAVGVEGILRMAKGLGIKSPLPAELSLALGACDVTPLEITTVYNTISAGGVYARPYLVRGITDAAGNVLYRHTIARRKVLRSAVCSDLSKMLKACMDHGTGQAAAVGWNSKRAAGKTGTSDGSRDAWFVGYIPKLTACIWVGHDDNSPLPGTGATLAAPIWASFMKFAARNS